MTRGFSGLLCGRGSSSAAGARPAAPDGGQCADPVRAVMVPAAGCPAPVTLTRQPARWFWADCHAWWLACGDEAAARRQ
jgi:hypothetical protein